MVSARASVSVGLAAHKHRQTARPVTMPLMRNLRINRCARCAPARFWPEVRVSDGVASPGGKPDIQSPPAQKRHDTEQTIARGNALTIDLHIVYKCRAVAGDNYRAALDAAISEYEKLGSERQAIDRRLSQLAQTIGTLSRLLGLTPTVPLGLTDACRLVLRAGVPMTPVEIRDRLDDIGVDLEVYANDLSAIHTVLRRLNEAGEIRLVPRASGKHAYLWQAPPRAVAIGEDLQTAIPAAGRRRPATSRAPRRRT